MSDPVRAYHERSKHQLQRYAAGPETLDWDAQPDPFRRWQGAPLTLLPLVADTLATPWAALSKPGAVPPRAVSLGSLGAFFELSLAITAWKQQGPDRWALRANPSSGNLHPTEAYLLVRGAAGLGDGLYHYTPLKHGLALRRALGVGHGGGHGDGLGTRPAGEPPQLWVGLASIHWREAWKYGERAFRYCQLDTGHALGALRYAAAVLGWQAKVVPGIGHAALAALLGLDRAADFEGAEGEEPELLVQIGPQLPAVAAVPDVASQPSQPSLWQGHANRLDPHPMYRWPVIDEVARSTRAAPITHPPATVTAPLAAALATSSGLSGSSTPSGSSPSLGSPAAPAPPAPPVSPAAAPRSHVAASTLIRERRSAQRFDRRGPMPAAAFFRLAAALLPQAGLPWDAWPLPARVHPVLFAHRVEGLVPGAYVLPRSDAGAALLLRTLQAVGAWQAVPEAPAGLPLARLVDHPALAGTLRTLCCHQAIASDACLAVSLLAEFDTAVDPDPSQYRALYQEAGLIGQVLYLQAEAEGLRGTGIGCYFDDAVHTLLGLAGTPLQALYHFTVGVPMADARIATLPPYAQRALGTEPDGAP